MASGELTSLEHHQTSRLRGLVALLAESNAFYRERWAKAGISAQVADLADFKARFPFTRKHDLVANQAENPPYGTNLTFPLQRYTRCHGTSGSTGRPLRWLDTPDSWQWMLNHWRRVYEAAGVTSADRVFFAFSFGPFLGFWTAFDAAQQLGCLCLPGGGLTSLARVRSILDQKATVLCCTPTYALHLAEVAALEGVDLRASSVRRILVAGEPGGSIPATRRRLEQAWQGATVHDHHGMTEVGPVSYQCPKHPAVLHVIETSYLAEILEVRTAHATGPGEVGELILTTLGREGSPLIRYRTGDLVRAPQQRGCCDCGSWDLALAGGILGRTDDMVVIRGVNVFPAAVDEVIRETGGVAEYRAEVQSNGALLELKVTIEPETGIAAEDAEATARRLESAFQTRLALRIPVLVVETGSLPRFEMKARRWIQTSTPGETSS
ncbi:MAG: AMP-binding protein [Verrucomicrobiales bacterium]|nr:AMP-binding protein [Verrucomicrobiales bacterium]